jgi:hypothetical protein
MSRNPTPDEPPFSGLIPGSGRISSSPMVRPTVSSMYKVDSPRTGISAPAASGPNTAPNMKTVNSSALAGATSPTGTRRGITALRVGRLTATNACCTPSRASTSHTECRLAKACAQSSAEVTAMPAPVTISNVRRSTASAMAPPHSPNTTSATRPTAPVRPT